MQFQKIFIPTPQEVIRFPRKYEGKQEHPKGFQRESSNRKNLCGGKGYFLGQCSIILIIFCIIFNKL